MSRIEDAILKVKAQAQARVEAQPQVHAAPASYQAPPVSAGPPPAPSPAGPGRTPPPAHWSAPISSASGTYRIPPDLAATTGSYVRPEHLPRPSRLVTIDLNALIEEGLVPPKDEARRVSNEFRAIKRTLIGNVTGRTGTRIEGGNIIMVASALAGEGKTFCAMNLALSLALEKDFSVVLVDGDVAKPNISRVLGIAEAPGLLDLLRHGEGTLAGLEIGTNIPRLTVVPAGRPGDDAAELLSSRRMAALVTEMHADPHRLFIFDSTPLLLTNESRVLAECAGQIMLVVRAAVTPRTAVKGAIAELPDNAYVGVVLNQKEASLGTDYYAYGEYGQPPKGGA